jgi:hypothetical protein
MKRSRFSEEQILGELVNRASQVPMTFRPDALPKGP